MTIDKVELGSVIGSGLGVAICVSSLAKGRGIRNIRYGNSEVALISSMSIFGGLVGGTISDKGRNTRVKVRESLQQLFGNIIIPIGVMAYVNRISKPLNIVARGVLAVGSLFTGTIIGHRIMDKVNSKLFKENRKYDITTNDFLCDADDGLYAVSTIAKKPFIYKAVASIIPLTFIYMGYQTGKQKENKRLTVKV